MVAGVTASGQQTAEAIRREAAESFAAHGYEATSLRQIAAAVGIKVGSLYNHIESKEDLLLAVMGGTMDDLNELMEKALEGKEDPLERLVAFLECHMHFHAERAQSVFIGNTELRSLQPEARKAITQKRRDYRVMLERLIWEVGAAGRAKVLDTRLHAFSVVAIGTHVASWYREDGGLSMAEIIATYSKIILRSLEVEDADAYVDAHVLAAVR